MKPLMMLNKIKNNDHTSKSMSVPSAQQLTHMPEKEERLKNIYFKDC
jgi:hypothetical protein